MLVDLNKDELAVIVECMRQAGEDVCELSTEEELLKDRLEMLLLAE